MFCYIGVIGVELSRFYIAAFGEVNDVGAVNNDSFLSFANSYISSFSMISLALPFLHIL